MGLFTYYVENRNYKANEVLRFINEDEYTHYHLRSSGGKISGGYIAEITGTAIYVAALITAFVLAVSNNNKNDSLYDKTNQFDSLYDDINQFSKAITKLCMRYHEKDLGDNKEFSGIEVTTFLNELNKAHYEQIPQEISNALSNNFAQKSSSGNPILEVISGTATGIAQEHARQVYKQNIINKFINHEYTHAEVPSESEAGYFFGPAAVLIDEAFHG